MNLVPQLLLVLCMSAADPPAEALPPNPLRPIKLTLPTQSDDEQPNTSVANPPSAAGNPISNPPGEATQVAVPAPLPSAGANPGPNPPGQGSQITVPAPPWINGGQQNTSVASPPPAAGNSGPPPTSQLPQPQELPMRPMFDPDPLGQRDHLDMRQGVVNGKDKDGFPLPTLIEPPGLVQSHFRPWPEIWGFVQIEAIGGGDRMPSNGVPYNPIFDISGELNIGILPHKKLYVFYDNDFWAQRAGANVTNPAQGSFDFSKREWDFTVGLAWNYYDTLELRALGYADNNLNRGVSLASPSGYNDGLGIENRYYFKNADPYDIGKLSFVSIGYMAGPSTMTGQDGKMFHMGLFLHAYLTYDIPVLHSYLYCDGQLLFDNTDSPRLFLYDAGIAIRPWDAIPNIEFRIGGSGVYDIQYQYDRSLGYVGARLQF